MTEKSQEQTGQPIVYVREAAEELLPDHLKGAPGKIYSVHDTSGNMLAVAQQRNLAFALAKRNGMAPISVH